MKSGIYKITNSVNNKIYIGSAVNLNSRKNEHWYELRNNKHHSKYLQRSWNKYKGEVFKFEIVEYCNIENLITREQYYIDTLKPKYNSCKIAGSMLGFKFTQDSKNKMKESYKKVPKEIKEYIITQRNKVLQKPMLQYDLNGNFIKEWNSFKEYVTKTGDNNKNIITVCKGRRKTASGFIFKYKKECLKY